MVKKLLVLSFVALTIQVQAAPAQTRMDAATANLVEGYCLNELPTIAGVLAQFSGQNLNADQTQTVMTTVSNLEKIVEDIAPQLIDCAELAALVATIGTIITEAQVGAIDPSLILLLVSEINAFLSKAETLLSAEETNDPASAATVMQITDYINSLPHPVIISGAVGTVTLAAFILYYGYKNGWFKTA